MRRPSRPRPPLNRAQLEELAVRYVARFATSRAKLAGYLHRKLRERGWENDGEPPVGEITERLAGLGYVDDSAFAMGRGRSLSSRGYGARRLAGALRAAGIGEADADPALETARASSAETALKFAKRRRIGPFADVPADPARREKWVAALVRAGHDYGLARRIADWTPGCVPKPGELGD